MKRAYNVHKIDPQFKKWLENVSRSPLLGIGLLWSPLGSPPLDAWRFRFEGIRDRHAEKYVWTPFRDLIPTLRWLLDGELVRVCKEVNSPYLILDLKSEESLYRKYPRFKEKEWPQEAFTRLKTDKVLEIFPW